MDPARASTTAGMRSPSVTVLMGVYNGLPRLEHAIRSIQEQTLQDFEFLIIDAII